MQHRKNNSESGEHHHQQQQAQSHHSSRKSGYVNSGAETEADTTSHASIKRNRRRQRLVILRLDTNQISNQSFLLPNSFFQNDEKSCRLLWNWRSEQSEKYVILSSKASYIFSKSRHLTCCWNYSKFYISYWELLSNAENSEILVLSSSQQNSAILINYQQVQISDLC